MWRVVKRYLANCNLHGTRYIVEGGLHWTERVFWLIVCVLCWWGCALMIKNLLDAYLYRSVAFTVESTYLNWQTDFPSVSVCMRSIPKSLAAADSLYSKKFGIKIRSNTLWRWLFSGSVQKPRKNEIEAFGKLTSDDVVYLYENSILNCTELMSECYWKSMKFNCCDLFKPLKTAAGICYTFNSKQTGIGNNRGMKNFTMNQNTGIGYLHVGITPVALSEEYVRIQVFVHNKLEIPTAVTYGDREVYLKTGNVVSVYVSLEETFNEPGLRSISAERRRCRLSDEIENFHTYKRYSNDGCTIDLQMKNMIRLCGCVSHLFPYHGEMPVCNYTGLQCLQHEKAAALKREELQDRCLPDCEGSVLRIYQDKYMNGDASLFPIKQGFHLELLALPTTRFKRYVVRSLLDLAVAVGSTVSLFMGAGILSLVEIPYWLLLRKEP